MYLRQTHISILKLVQLYHIYLYIYICILYVNIDNYYYYFIIIFKYSIDFQPKYFLEKNYL